MGAGQHFDRLGVRGVPGDLAVVVPVGADQISEQLGIPGIGFRALDVVAVAVSGRRHRVDRPHLIPGCRQLRDPHAAIGFNADHHLIGFIGVGGDQFVQAPDTGEALG